MIDPRIISLLDSPDTEKRRRAIMALARTKDRAALPHLARVYKTDSDPELRELARKGGQYISKHAPATPAEPESDPASRLYADDQEETGAGAGGSLYADEALYEEEEEAAGDEIPLPSEIRVSQAEITRAQGFVDQALDWNVRGNNDRAAEYLRRAFNTNPRLMHDSYARSLAGSITGLDDDRAVQLLAPGTEEVKRRTSEFARVRVRNTPLHMTLAGLMLFGAIIVLAAYFAFPWIDFNSLEVIGEDGRPTTVGAAMDEARSQFDQLRGFLGGEDSEEFDRMIDAFNSLNFDWTGLDTTLLALGIRDVIDVVGLRPLLDLFGDVAGVGDLVGDVGSETDVETDVLDYTLPLIPISAVIALLLAFALTGRLNLGRWVWSILVGVVGMIPLIYLYLERINAVVAEVVDAEMLGSLSQIPTGRDLIGLGYWVALAGMLAIVLLPFIALLFAPAPKSAEA